MSNLEAWDNSEIVKGIRWLANGPDPCDECMKNDGEVRKIGEKFPSGDKYPLAHVNCGCILEAVFDSTSPTRLMPTDLRKPKCPYCQNALKKIPGAKTKCSQCGQFMYVRTRPEDGARVVVTEAEAHRINEAWESKIIGRAREPVDAATIADPEELATTITLQPRTSAAHAQPPRKWYYPQTWLAWLRSPRR
jgi:hypothetical protein